MGESGGRGICTVNRDPGDQIEAASTRTPTPAKERYQGRIDPLLLHLSQNGGPTPTHALLAGNPAIDAGNPRGITARTVSRPLGSGGSGGTTTRQLSNSRRCR
ncbi:MAG: choice-of-anchor Q domain-containing protein [Gammaproteobacteria bacterium]